MSADREAEIEATLARMEATEEVPGAWRNRHPATRHLPHDERLDSAFGHLRTWNPFTAPPAYKPWGHEVPDPAA